MPYPAELVINKIRQRNKTILIRPVEFVAAPDAVSVSEEYKLLQQKHHQAVDAMMHEATFGEKVTQIVASITASTAFAAAPVVLNPVAMVNPITAVPVVALSTVLATATFDLIYHQLETRGDGAQYLRQLQDELGKNAAYSNIIKQAFDNMAQDMLRAFCLRELRLQECHDDDSRKKVNDDYLAYLVVMLNQNIKTIYGEHQADIEADANQWWIWKVISNVFLNQEERKTTTQAIQLGLLGFVGKFHHSLADEKSWVGKHPFRTTIYSALVGILIGGVFSAAFAISWLLLVGGVSFAAAGYMYAKNNPYKRSLAERNTHLAFEQDILEGQEALKAKLLQADSLSENDVKLLKDHRASVNDGYLSKAHVAVGAASSWARTFARHYAHSKLVENDFAPEIKTLIQRADQQTDDLVNAIKRSAVTRGGIDEYLRQYMQETRTYLLQDQGISVQRKYELVEKAKEQLLEAISRVGNIVLTPNLNDFCKELYGNDDQLELAQKFCPAVMLDAGDTRVSCYNALLEKANALANLARDKAIFVGNADYWLALGIQPLEQSTTVTSDNIATLLNSTRQFLRHLNPPVERGHETDATHSEAYYLYRTLIMRQFAVLIIEKKVDEACAAQIKGFIENTLHATKIDMAATVDEILHDIYYHDIQMPTPGEIASDDRTIEKYPNVKVKNIEYIANAMRIDLAYHPIVSPAERVEQCIHEFIDQTRKALILGNTTPEVLARLNFASSAAVLADTRVFIQNTQYLLQTLKAEPRVEDQWNKAPVDLHYAYKDIVTRQTLFALKTMLQALANCDIKTDEAKIQQLRQAYGEMYAFLTIDCFKLDEHIEASVYLAGTDQKFKNHETTTSDQVVRQAKNHGIAFKLDKIFDGDMQLDIPEPTAIQENLKLNRMNVVQVAQDTLLLNYKPGRDAQPVEDVPATFAPRPSIQHRLAVYFSKLIEPSKPLKKPTALARHQATITKPVSLYASLVGKSNQVAKGTPEAWQRILDRELTVDPNASLDNTRQLQEEAKEQTMTLLKELQKAKYEQIERPILNAYITETQAFLDANDKNGSLARYQFIEQTKAQVLELISASDLRNVPSELTAFIVNTLGGSREQVDLVVDFCPFVPVQPKIDIDGYEELTSSSVGNHDRYQFLVKKAKQVQALISTFDDCFVGDKKYWQMLGCGEAPLQSLINENTLDVLLNNSKILLRKLNNPIEWSDVTEYENTEAYYVYRTLLVRQLAVLMHEGALDDVSKRKIKNFITNTLHVNPDVMLDDAYFYGKDLEEKPAHVAGALVLNLAYQSAIPLPHLLDSTIEAYVTQNFEPFVFGDPREKTLQYLDPIKNANFSTDIVQFISSTSTFLAKLKAPAKKTDVWNEAPIDLYYAYKHLVTEQAILTLNAILFAMSKEMCREKTVSLSEAYKAVHEFLMTPEYCYQLDAQHQVALAIEASKEVVSQELPIQKVIAARRHVNNIHLKIDVDNLFHKDYKTELEQEKRFEQVRRNTVVGELSDAAVSRSCISITMRAGEDADAAAQRRAARELELSTGALSASSLIYRFFSAFSGSASVTPPPTSPGLGAVS